MKQFKIRCSAIGLIMTNAKKKGELSKTAQSYCKDWIKEQIYSRRKEFTSKYTDKGNIVEDTSIDTIGNYLNLGMIIKNEEDFSNDFMTGTPDLNLSELVIDAKNSWDCFTFPLFETDIPDKKYYWQLQGYMALTGKDKAMLCYTLEDTPLNITEREAYYHCKSNGFDELDQDVFNEFVHKHTYSDIDIKYKIKIFDVARDNDAIMAIQDRVIECREYIETLL